ncbi:MAG: lipoprotein signal peptidase [Saprospirales bacterium]|nr:lipoprotein signal peptidase [Saprospirales bacterium]
MKPATKVTLLVLLILLIDQTLKIWVKTHLEYGDEIFLFGWKWARIHFVENNGMAFGLSLGGEYGKLALSLFRILAVLFLIYYLRFLIKEKASLGLLASFSMILAGAVGNILDSAFYGLIFSESSHHTVATLFPPGGGYAGFLHGMVVDMLYFPIVEDKILPDWVPFASNRPFTFFRPVFNIADSAITVGVFSLILFHRQFFSGRIHPAAETSAIPDTPEPKPEGEEEPNRANP